MSRRDLYLITHNTHNGQTSIPPVGFEPTISAGKRPQTYVLDRVATGDRLCRSSPLTFAPEGLPGSDNSFTRNMWMFITCLCVNLGQCHSAESLLQASYSNVLYKYFVSGDHCILLTESKTEAESRRYERHTIRVLYTTQKRKAKDTK
jgi:hypothetical protein